MKPETITITIGRLSIGFIVKSRLMANLIRKRYNGFLNRAVPRLCVDCTFSRSRIDSGIPGVRVERVSANTWNLVRRDFRCTISERGGVAWMHPSVYTFDAFMRVLFGTLLPGTGGLLLHSAGVVLNDLAHIFIGPSGAGKTTVTRLIPEGKVLSDEITALTVNNHGTAVTAQATPFWGAGGRGMAVNTRYRATGLFFLCKHRSVKIVPVDPAEAVQRILECTCVFSRCITQSLDCLDTVIQVLKRVPSYRLFFDKNRYVHPLLLDMHAHRTPPRYDPR